MRTDKSATAKENIMAKNRVGAFWINEYKQEGVKKKMLSGTLDLGVLGEQRVVMFPNGHKENEKAPDWFMYISEEADSAHDEAEASQGNGQSEGETEEDPFV